MKKLLLSLFLATANVCFAQTNYPLYDAPLGICDVHLYEKCLAVNVHDSISSNFSACNVLENSSRCDQQSAGGFLSYEACNSFYQSMCQRDLIAERGALYSYWAPRCQQITNAACSRDSHNPHPQRIGCFNTLNPKFKDSDWQLIFNAEVNECTNECTFTGLRNRLWESQCQPEGLNESQCLSYVQEYIQANDLFAFRLENFQACQLQCKASTYRQMFEDCKQ